ncbi:hypothetical protein G7046_g1985 [Stylonectria norvegica]|nr:hypothetical protein G7046_g1985 [Stylonectria norvegica]
MFLGFGFWIGFLAVPVQLVSASCAHGTLLHPRVAGEVEVKHFGYIGVKGPTNWYGLDPEANGLCALGKNQSPIDMLSESFSVIPAAELSLSIPDMPEGTDFENLGTTVEVVAEGGSMSFGGVSYSLKQFHFHLPSEHLDNGTSMAMEMHMVWEGDSKQVAVISTFVDIDDSVANDPTRSNCTATASTALVTERRTSTKEKHVRRTIAGKQSAKRRQLPSVGGSLFHVSAPPPGSVTASKLLETVLGSVETIATPGSSAKTKPLFMSELVATLAAGTFQTYEGSLTTPPCSEGVRWLVSDQKLSIKTATFLKARSVIGFNSRFPQNALGEDNILYHKA